MDFHVVNHKSRDGHFKGYFPVSKDAWHPGRGFRDLRIDVDTSDAPLDPRIVSQIESLVFKVWTGSDQMDYAKLIICVEVSALDVTGASISKGGKYHAPLPLTSNLWGYGMLPKTRIICPTGAI